MQVPNAVLTLHNGNRLNILACLLCYKMSEKSRLPIRQMVIEFEMDDCCNFDGII